ncbi:MAG: molybdopterin cofactor-binding domain-containing protein [Rhodospirillaceae bacterium]
MSRIGKLTRRAFLIGTGTLVGGVAFGGYFVTRPAANPLTAASGEAALTPFVFIDPEGITLIAPRAEMGQGVRTTWAALIAEELDVTLEAIKVIHGPAAHAYFNAALIAGTPDYATEPGSGQGLKATLLALVSKQMGLQVTGGSTSIRDGFLRMREVGASARETLKQAAAQRLGIERTALKTENGFVIAPDGTRIAYADLAGIAADLEVITDVPLRARSAWRILGRSQPRVDMVEKATGIAEFAMDIRLPGLKFAALRRNPALDGPMNGFDATAALQMPGVERVVDLGDGVAVVASNSWLALQAAEAIVFDWGSSPHPKSMTTVFDAVEAAFDGDVNSTLRDDGDATAIPDGAEVITASYRLPYLAHATMEPMNATALFQDGKLILWSGNQGPMATRNFCADAVGIDADQVEVITPYMGGGFGRRAEVDFSVYAAKLAREMPGIPVQLLFSREEDMTHDYYRPGGIARFTGAVQDGRAVLLDGQVAGQSCEFQFMGRIGAPTGGEDKTLVAGLVDQPYAIPNYRIRGYVADLHFPVGFWRSVGYSLNGFFLDCFLDEMAHKAGADPLAFRLQTNNDLDPASTRTLEAVRDMSGWTGQTPEGVGRGVGFTYSFGTPVAIAIEVQDRNSEIHLTQAWIACDMGLALDPAIIEAQMISGMVYGLSAACYEEITFTDGRADQRNFPDYEVLRMRTMPKTEVTILETTGHIGGAGEPSTPPAMPALANAVFDLTGTRPRSLPLAKEFPMAI